MKPSTRLKTILAARSAAILPGTPNALFARVIAQHGFPAVYVTGAGIANMSYGFPDIGLVTLAELTDHVAAIADAVERPILVDADTGFGNPLNVMRTRAAAGTRGRGGHPARGPGVSEEVRALRRQAGDRARRDGAEDQGGVRRAPRRRSADRGAHRCARDRGDRCGDRAGAGLCRGGRGCDLRGGAGRGTQSSRAIARELAVPQIANMVFGGLTPPVSRGELAALGFGAVLYANAALQAALWRSTT